MTSTTRILGTSTALAIAACAAADLRYDEVILSAESNCLTGSDRALFQQELDGRSHVEASSGCGGGETSAFLETGVDYFIISAGSTVPGQSLDADGKTPMITDGGNGHGAVEVSITIDRPTLFRMTRCLEGSKVVFWDDDYRIAELDGPDQATPLPKGTYWATIETDAYGTPVWAEIDWQQQKQDDPADLNGDGRIDGADLAALIALVSDAGAQKKPQPKPGSKPESKPESKPKPGSAGKPVPSFGTGGTCTDRAMTRCFRVKGERSDKHPLNGARPLPRPKPGSFGSKGTADGNAFDGRPRQEIEDWSDAAEGSGFGGTTNANKGFDGSIPPAASGPTLDDNGDLNADGKVDIKDIVYLMGRL